MPPPSRALEQMTSLPPGRESSPRLHYATLHYTTLYYTARWSVLGGILGESSPRLAEADAAVEADAVAVETE